MIIHKIFIIIILIIITFFNKIISKHYFLFNWYCNAFFNFKEKLTKKELKYIYNVFNHSPIEILNKTMDGKRLSYMTFSHIINNTKVDSSRFCIGSIILPELSFHYALDILKERDIKLPKYLLTNSYKFGGLGWDFNKNYFKIYFRCLNKNFFYKHKDIYDSIQNKLMKQIKNDYKSNKYWKEGLISFTYKNNQLYEKKLYMYPKYSKKKSVTYMISNLRGIIKQVDIINQDNVNNEIGTKIIEEYKKINIKLDTISKVDNNQILYFPR